jgi:uncharacterized protein
MAGGSTAFALSLTGWPGTAAARGRLSGRVHEAFRGYGNLVPDPAGLLDLPEGFRYAVLSREGDALASGGRVPSLPDGMAAFAAGPGRSVLVRNHEVEPDDVAEGLTPVAHVDGATYDPEGVGGTTTLLVNERRERIAERVSLAGTLNNCAGGPTPWGTWLSCEESDAVLARPHGYVFEVDPRRGGNPEPIRALGRFEHEALAFARDGSAYLTEDASGSGGLFGCFYRFQPRRPLRGRGSLHAGGSLAAMAVLGVDADLSSVQLPHTRFPVEWVGVPNADPQAGDTPVREQVIALGATPIPKAEGAWQALDGAIYFVSSRGDGPDAEDEEDRSAAVHSGQIWRYDPFDQAIELCVIFHPGTPLDEPDNITAGPHGFAVACTDGGGDQYLIGISDSGGVFPFAFNRLNEEEFAGATFSPNGRTLFANLQGPPGLTFAIWGPWRRGRA